MANTAAPFPGETRLGGGQIEANGGAGSSNTVIVPLRGTTTDATATVLYADGDSTNGVLLVPTDESWAFTIQMVGSETGGDSGAYFIRGCIENDGGTTAIIGTNVADTPMEDTAGWACTATANDTLDSLEVKVTGEAAKNVNWSGIITISRSYNV